MPDFDIMLYMNEDLKYWLALSRVEGVGPVKTKRLLEQYGSAKAICEALNCDVAAAEPELERIKALNVKAMVIEDENYPDNLKNIYDPPPILFIKGDITKSDQTAIAIVGTRRATRYGLETARKFAAELSQLGITIISGLAIGIDTASHEGAMEAKGRTIAVLGSGVDQIFPRTNQQLAEKIEQNGALVSEFSLGQQPESWTFPQRNRVISGLSLGVIMVEGHYDSGAMITAKLALEQGREVFAVPGNVQLDQSKGPHWLIKQGAKLVESVDDVLDELKSQIPTTKSQIQISKSKIILKSQYQNSNTERRYSDLSSAEQKIMAVLSFDPKHIDAISSETGFSIPQVSGMLMVLEIKKVIRQLPGKLFILN